MTRSGDKTIKRPRRAVPTGTMKVTVRAWSTDDGMVLAKHTLGPAKLENVRPLRHVV